MAKSRQELEAIKKRFEDDKKRFRELKGLPPAAPRTQAPVKTPQ